MTYKRFYSLLFLITVLISCKKELPFPDVNAESILVMNGLLCRDSLIQVHISETCKINEATACENEIITDASVTLYDGAGNALSTMIHQGNGIYTPLNVGIEQQSSYRIEASHQNREVSSTAIVPQPFDCNYIGKSESNYDGVIAWGFDIEIVDDPDVENYYLLEGYIDILNGEHFDGESEVNGYIEPHTSHYTNDINAENTAISTGFDLTTYPLRSVYLPDENFNGEVYQTRFGIRDFDVYDPVNQGFKAQLTIKSVSKEMYDYYKSLEKYRLSQNNLFAEPEPIFSNIDKGLGIFAGYSQQTFTIDLPASEYVLPSNIFVTNNGCSAPCTLSFSTDGGSSLGHNWDFGDGQTSTLSNPEHSYNSPGQYTVTLSVAEAPGSIIGITTTVTVN